MSNNLKCELVSLYKKEIETKIEMAILPTEAGEVGVLRNHIPMLFMLKEGVIRLIFEDKTEKKFLVNRGFAEVVGEALVILSDDIINMAEIEDISKHKPEALNKFSKARISALVK